MPQAIPAIIVAFKAAVAKITIASVVSFAIKTAIVFGVSKLLMKRSLGGFGQDDAGARVQLPPASQNILPVVYGKAYIKPTIVDAKISTDQKTMWYVCALAEHTDSTAGSGYTFGDIYWNGARCNFSGATVTSTTNNAGQTDNKMNGSIFIYRFPNGSASGITPGASNAITLLSDSQIPSTLRWSSFNSIYTTGNNAGKTAAMTNTCFIVVKLIYNQDADILGLGELTVELTNSIVKPGDAIKDYLLNERYGCAVPLDNIDTTSLTDLNTYSDQTITYTNTGGSPATQARYRINGPVNTAQPCLRNLQDLVDACDSWIQYSDLEDKWKVVINKPYDVAPNAVTTGNLYHVISDYTDNSNLIGGIQINPIDLNASYNIVQVAYPDTNVRDQTNYEIFDFIDPTSDWYDPTLLSPNEPINKLDFELPQVNNYIQSAYLGVRRLLQSREDLVVTFQLDYSGIQIEAGDVIKITSNEYGWAEKLFRVSQVQEIKDEASNLYAKIQAFEYNDTIYGDNALTDYVPAENTGLDDPNVIGTPIAPTVELVNIGALKYIKVTGTVPTGGITQYLDFNYGTSSDSQTHLFYKTVTQSSGNPFADGTTVSIELNDIPVGVYYFSVTARNDLVGQRGTSSTPAISWLGTDIAPYIELTINNVTSSGNLFFTDAGNAYTNLYAGGNIFIGSGPGILAPNTFVINVANSTHFYVSDDPIVGLSGTTLLVDLGGINGDTILPNTLPGNTVIPNTLPGNTVIGNTLPGNTIIPGTANGNIIINGTLNGNAIITNTANGNIIINGTITNVQIANDTIISNNIAANAIVAGKIDANAITAGTIAANAITAGTIAANAVTAGTIDANAVTANTIAANAVTAGTVAANAVTAGTIAANAVTSITIAANAITAGKIDANAVIAGTIAANAVTAGTIDANAVTAGSVAANAITAGTIAANAVTSNTVAANAITAGTIAANAVTAGTIAAGAITAGSLAANSVTANEIAANAITAGKIDANAVTANTIAANAVTAVQISAGAVYAGAVQANAITTAELAIGSVTQARSTISPVQFEFVPYYNWPSTPKTWPDNTRAVYPVGGASIIPTTDPQSSANVEYSEGSRITIGVTAHLYTAANSEYNCIEVWKSGASTVFDRGFNLMKHSYNGNANTVNITPTIHALGFGSYNLYSDDGGATWATFATNVSITSQTFTGGEPIWLGNSNVFPNGFEMVMYGPTQDLARIANIQYFNTGLWTNDGTPTTEPELDVAASYLTPNVANSANTPVNFTSSCYAPNTGGVGDPFIGVGFINRYSSFVTGENGIIYFNEEGLRPDSGAPLYAEPTGTLQPLYDIFANDTDAGNLYTVCAVGGTGTIVRSIRDFDSYNRNAHPTWSSRSTTLANGQPVLTILYGVAGDSSQHGNGNWVAVGQYGMIQFSSDDGDSWSQVLSPIPDDLNCVRYGNGKWVAAGDNGVILTTSDPGNANAWTQVNSGLTDRNLFKIDYSPDYDTFNIGGQSIILNSNSANINFAVTYSDAPAETYDLTRLTFFGSHPLVSNVALPPEEQRLVNGSVFSTTVIDTQYVEGQETTYFLVVGNLNGEPLQVGQAFILVQELKR